MTACTVAIPTIPDRYELLCRAVDSVRLQTEPCEVSLALDRRGRGAPATRDAALRAVATPWVAFLDDDDTLKPQHVQRLLATAEQTGADYVYAWFDMVGGTDPFPEYFGAPWNNDHPHQTTVTVLVRTELAKAVGFQSPAPGRTINGQRWGEDYQFTVNCMALGARIVHLPERTWNWHHHGANTSGQPLHMKG